MLNVPQPLHDCNERFSRGQGSALVALVGLERGGRALALVALEQRPQRQHLGQDAAGGPHVGGRRVVAGAQQQLRRAIPDRHYHAVVRQRPQRACIYSAHMLIAELVLYPISSCMDLAHISRLLLSFVPMMISFPDPQHSGTMW